MLLEPFGLLLAQRTPLNLQVPEKLMEQMQVSLQPQDGQQVPRLRARYLGQSMESMLSKGLLKPQVRE